MTTYGLMSLEQDDHGEVQGVYWYGEGTVHGSCTIDSDHEVLILEYEWSQSRKQSRQIGSKNDGFGVFYLPAGYEAFLGHWYNKGEPGEPSSRGAERDYLEGWSAISSKAAHTPAISAYLTFYQQNN